LMTLVAGNPATVPGGCLGIGTSNPCSRLDVEGGKLVVQTTSNSYGQVQILNPSGNEASMAFAGNVTGGQGGAIECPTVNNLWILGAGSYSNPATVFGIANVGLGKYILAANSNGNVGIGTTNPGATLDVSGTALFKPASDSTSAFQVQSAEGTVAMNVDTTSGTMVTVDNLTVNGTLTANGVGNGLSIKPVSSSSTVSTYSPGNENVILIDTSSNFEMTITLPPVASSNGKSYYIRNTVGSGDYYIRGYNNGVNSPDYETVENAGGALAYEPATGSTQIVCDGKQWWVLSTFGSV
jgi:predicted outer membrane repeat protein